MSVRSVFDKSTNSQYENSDPAPHPAIDSIANIPLDSQLYPWPLHSKPPSSSICGSWIDLPGRCAKRQPTASAWSGVSSGRSISNIAKSHFPSLEGDKRLSVYSPLLRPVPVPNVFLGSLEVTLTYSKQGSGQGSFGPDQVTRELFRSEIGQQKAESSRSIKVQLVNNVLLISSFSDFQLAPTRYL